MVFAGTGTRGETHSGEVADSIEAGLVCGDSGVTFIVVGIRPHSFRCSKVSWASEISHCPEARPETGDITATGKGD